MPEKRRLKTPHFPWLGVLIRLTLLALITWGAFMAGCGRAPLLLPPDKPPASRSERIEIYRKTLKAYQDAGRLPIIDLELMLTPDTDIEKIVQVMDNAGVALAAVTSHDTGLIRRALERHPERFIPLSPAPRGTEWADPERAFLKTVRRTLREDRFGIGRIRMDLDPAESEGKGKKRAKSVKRQKAAFEALLRLSSEQKAPIWLEMDPEDHGLGWLERQLREHAGATVIWTRAGYFPFPEKLPGYGSGLLRAVTLRRPNLFMTLTVLPPAKQRIFLTLRKNLLFDPGGAFSPEWRALIEARIAHFGTGGSLDAAKPGFYLEHMQRFRSQIMDALTPPARERLAWRNAWRLLTGSEWSK